MRVRLNLSESGIFDPLLQLQDYADEEINSCDTGLITGDGEEINEGTVGDALCERMFNFTFPDEATRTSWYAKSWKTGAKACRRPCPPQEDCNREDCCPEKKKGWEEFYECQERREKEGVMIGAYHSYCGTDWQEVATGTGKARKTLDLKRTLCCYKRPNPVCKDGKILKTSIRSKGLASKAPNCEGPNAFSFGCPCPELPVKPKYWPCSYEANFNFNKVCEKKK